MNQYEIINSETNEVVDTADTERDAFGVAAHLSATTKVLHFVPAIRVDRALAFAV